MQNKESLYAMALALLALTAGAAEAQVITPMPATPAVAKPAPVKRHYRARRTVRPVVRAIVHQINVTREANATRITIVADRPITPNITPFNSRCTLISIGGVWAPGRWKTEVVGQNGVNSLRFGQFQDYPQYVVRIAANTVGAVSFVKQGSSDGRQWDIIISAPTAVMPPIVTANAAPKKAPAAANTLGPQVAYTGFIRPTPPAPATPAPQPAAKLVAATPPARKPSHAPVNTAPVYVTRSSETTGSRYSGLLRTPTPKPAPMVMPDYVPAPASRAPHTDPPAAQQEPARTNVSLPVRSDDVPLEDIARRVSLDFVAADINDVLKALSLQSGINIVTGNDVKGNITVSLKRVSMNEALDMVTRLSGYTYARFGSAYVVGTPASVGSITARSEKPVENVTEFIPYRYTSSATLYRILQDRFPGLKLPEADKNEIASQQKLLVLTDSPKRASEVREFVSRLEQVASLPVQAAATEIYQVRYASPTDLIAILAKLVPTVSVQIGPAQGFQPNALGGSASFQQSSPSTGPTGGAGGTASSVATAGTQNAGSSSSGRMAPNVLILTGATPDIVRAKDFLGQIDVKVPQLIYEARVVDVSNEDISRLGLQYDFTRTVQVGENNVVPGTATVGSSTAQGPGRPVNFGTIFRTPYSIGVQLDALITGGKTRLLANPNISSLDGQPAIAFIGDQVKYVISIQQTPTGQTIQTETATVGITLKVTGKASPDGTVTLYVHPEVSIIRDFLNVGGGISLPQISTRFVDTTIRVKDGETIAIGGLIREQDIENIRKVPFLGDLPFFGPLLFKNKQKTKQSSNLVIFITSRVVKE